MIFVAFVTRRNVLEICETGEQGGLIVGSESSVKLQSRKLHWVTFRSFNFKMMNS